MTEAETTVLAVIKWAVSPERPAPEIDALDEELLLRIALHHRILGQMVRRIETARPVWCPPRLLTKLRIKQHQARQTVQTKVAAAQEISRALRTRGLAPPIFVKGFAAYALTADPALLHYSGDLDPFAQELPALEAVLHELGYSGKRKETHEWAKLRRGEITLDLHQYFPSLSYPPAVLGLPAAQLEAQQNPGHWALSLSESRLTLAEAQIRWEDLDAGAVPGAAAGTEEILFPSPTLLCLIHCAHCFRVCMSRLHYMDLFGGFRLYELLSVQALARLPGFDPDQFEALTARFSAQDAVRFVNALAEVALGVQVVPGQDTAGKAFPERLIYGGWILLQETEDWLWPRGITQMTQQLGTTIAPSSCRLETQTVDRLLTQGADPPAFQIALDWSAAQKFLSLDWMVSNIGPAEHELLVHFGGGSVIKTRLSRTGEVVSVSQKSDYGQMNAQAAASVSGAVRLVCAVPTLPDTPASFLPLFLAVRRLTGNGDGTEAASYLPVQLVARSAV